MAHKDLSKAKNGKNDEFYTQYNDIEKARDVMLQEENTKGLIGPNLHSFISNVGMILEIKINLPYKPR